MVVEMVILSLTIIHCLFIMESNLNINIELCSVGECWSMNANWTTADST